ESGDRLHNFFRTLVREIDIREEVIVQPERQAFMGQSPIDLLQYGFRSVSSDVAAPKQLCESNRILNVAGVLDRRSVIRDTTDAGTIQFHSSAAKQLSFGMAQEHKLTARHFDLANTQRIQLNDHVVDREIVITERPNSDIQAIERAKWRGGANQPGRRGHLREVSSRRHASDGSPWTGSLFGCSRALFQTETLKGLNSCGR